MVTKTDRQARRTTTVPVTKIEEIPVLTEEERAALRVALERAEASVKAGEAVEYDRKTFKDRLLAIYRGKRQAG